MAAQMIINKKEPWQEALSRSVTVVADLLDYLELSQDLALSNHDFSLRVPWSYVQCMQKGDPHDPLLRQVLPIAAEFAESPGFVTDPLQEAAASPTPGVLHKYPHRALVVVTGGCAIHCRYCFRRHFPYDEHALSKERWQAVLAYLHSRPDINEVILSGGDPLLLKDATLARIFSDLQQLPSIEKIRIHSRIPVVLPERMTTNLWRTLGDVDCPVVLVLHANHANELSDKVAAGLYGAGEAGVLMLNQSVLLRGVNDSVAALRNLSERLLSLCVLPYYLHLLDPVKGVGHFDVSEEEGKSLIQQLITSMPGYLVPKLVREEAGLLCKRLVK